MIPLRRPTTLGTRGARVLAWFALLGSLGLGAAQDGGGPAPDREAVAALFAEHCTLCHGGASPTLGLDLGDLQGALRGSDRGPVVVPGDPEASELVMRLRGTSQPRMPLTGPPYLDDEQIGLVVDWIAAGASAGPDGEAGASAEPAAEPTAEPGAGGPDDEAETAPPRPGSFADVETILSSRCVHCHRPEGALGPAPEGLILTSHAAVLGGGDRIAVVPGTPLASELFRRVAGLATPRMPFDGPPWLSDAEIERIRLWIEAGAPGPDGRPADIPVGGRIRLEGTRTGRWAIDGLPLAVTGATRIDDDPDVGDTVEVRAVVEPDGGVRATRVRER